MNNVSTVRIILFRVITIVFFALPGTCIYIPKAYSQVPAPSVYTEHLGFVKVNTQFLIFDILNSHWKSNFCCKELDPTDFICCLKAGFIDGTGEIKREMFL